MATRNPEDKNSYYNKEGGYVPNGCGPEWLPDKFKDSYFESQCAVHDLDYYEGLDRSKADKKFYHLMLARVAEEKSWKVRLARRTQALWYYRIVRVFGSMFHNDD